jgi:hypothetical protein
MTDFSAGTCFAEVAGPGGERSDPVFARSARPAIGPVAVTTAPKGAQRARRGERSERRRGLGPKRAGVDKTAS